MPVTIDHDTGDYETICAIPYRQTLLRVLRSPNNGDYDMEVLTPQGWESYNLTQVQAYHLLQVLGDRLQREVMDG